MREDLRVLCSLVGFNHDLWPQPIRHVTNVKPTEHAFTVATGLAHSLNEHAWPAEPDQQVERHHDTATTACNHTEELMAESGMAICINPCMACKLHTNNTQQVYMQVQQHASP